MDMGQVPEKSREIGRCIQKERKYINVVKNGMYIVGYMRFFLENDYKRQKPTGINRLGHIHVF